MFAKIFVLLAIGLGPEGSVMTYQAGSFETPETCMAAQKQLRADATARGVAKGNLFTVCIQTPWDIKGQHAA